MSEDTLVHRSPTLRVLPVVLFNLLVYFVIGLPNAVLGALFVHKTLGFSTGLAGTTITMQYLGTFLTRLVAGQLVDRYGSKKILAYGLMACTLSGLLVCLAALIPSLFGRNEITRYTALAIAMLSRLFIGWAESWTATSVTAWNIRRVGQKHTSVAISWNGVTSYGGIGIGVFIGEYLSSITPAHINNLLPIGFVTTLLGTGGLGLLMFYKALPPLPSKGAPMSFFRALHKVLPYGAGLSAGSFGFGTINGFLALYYSANHWQGLSTAWIIFAIVFITVRIFFSSQIDKRGGMPVAFLSLLTEAIAMAIFCCTHDPYSAIAATALTGAGFSLLFPALGTMAVKTDGPEYGGILLAAYSIFTDLTNFLVGPLMGALKNQEGWSVMFSVVGGLCFSGIIISYFLSRLPGSGIPDKS